MYPSYVLSQEKKRDYPSYVILDILFMNFYGLLLQLASHGLYSVSKL